MLKNNAEPHETEEMIPALLEKIDYPPEMEAFYTRRLRYGLEQYYRQQLLEEDQTD
jgi:hypothetical protein